MKATYNLNGSLERIYDGAGFKRDGKKVKFIKNYKKTGDCGGT